MGVMLEGARRIASAAFAGLVSIAAWAQGPLPRTISDVVAQVEKAADPPGAAAARDVLKRAAPASASLELHLARAAAAAQLGQTDMLRGERRRIVELTAGERNQPKHLIDLAIVELTAGNWVDAERFVQRAAQSATAYYGQDVGAMALLARMRSWMGDVGAARTSTAEVERQFARARLYAGSAPYVELVAALVMWAKADTFLAEGKATQAESALREAVDHITADTGLAANRADSIERAPAPDVTWQLLDLMEVQLARFLAVQGRAGEAEAIARRMLARNLSRYGRSAAPTAVAMAALGEVLLGTGRWTEAKQVSDAATRMLEASGTRAASAFSFAARKVRIDALVGESRWNEAASEIVELHARLAGQGAMLSAAERQGAWALAMLKTRRAATAAEWLGRLYEEQRKNLGEDRYETAESLGLLGAAQAAEGNPGAALEAFLKAVPVLIAPGNAAAADTEHAIRRIKRRAVLLAYIGLLHDIQGGPLAAKSIDAAAEALRIGDALRGGAVQSALAASAARALAGTPKLGALIRREQDTKRELQLLDARMLALAIAPPSRERDAALSEARARAASLEEERRKLLRDIEQQFPSYADLVSPRPAGLEQARKALRPNEALVSIVSSEDRTFVWAVGAGDRFLFRASAFAAPEIAAVVARLRAPLDAETVSVKSLGRLDLRAAHLLYVELLAPVAAAWREAADLTVVTEGALARLPLAMLPVEPPPETAPEETPFEAMKKVAWLSRRVSVTNVPSINAFVRLRALPAGNRERAALIGFGDPKFAGEDADYSRLAPLPETRFELQSIAAALGADRERDLFLGEAASRRNVLGTDLSRRRIVAFATHGLVPGELPGLAQPALALSYPRERGESALLTLEDVLGLKLDADLVVLSACNTAASDGRGAEALSGLGRGFFYAGSRALLATHWPVETEAARALVAELFARYSRDPAMSRAQALRQAMLALIDGPGRLDRHGKAEFSYAHPLFWAPYALYGDGAR
jgi:CHAT domain-containing protein